MSIDVAAHLGAVSRVVATRMQDGQEMLVVIASRAYDTTVDDLWDAVTDKARLARWFAQVDGELKLGGQFQVKNNASGTVTTCVPPKAYSVTWEFGGGVSWVNVALQPTKDGGAHLTVEHIAPPNPHWDKFGAGAGGVGWELGLLGLGMHLRSREARDKFDEHVWGVSEEGKEFVRVAGEGWIAAEIAHGEALRKPRNAASARSISIGANPSIISEPRHGDPCTPSTSSPILSDAASSSCWRRGSMRRARSSR